MSKTHSAMTSRLAFSTISPLFVDRFGRFLRFCHIEFDKGGIFDGCMNENARCRWGVLNLFNGFGVLVLENNNNLCKLGLSMYL